MPSRLDGHVEPEARRGDLEALFAAARDLANARFMPLSTGQPEVALVPAGFEVQSLKPLCDEWRDAPERREGTAVAGDIQSFAALVSRFADDDTAVWCQREPSPGLIGIIDYHRAGPAEQAQRARFGRHRILYRFPPSEPWRAWADADDAGLMDQSTFAEFLAVIRVDDVGRIVVEDDHVDHGAGSAVC